MKYPESYIYNHDIDWFFVANGVYYHVASAGGGLPDQINDDEYLRKIQHQVELLPDIYTDEEIVYNEEAIAGVLGENGVKGGAHYIESFTAMSRKGFVSIDRTNIGDLEDNKYHVVCWPKDNDRKPQKIELKAINKKVLDNLFGFNQGFIFQSKQH